MSKNNKQALSSPKSPTKNSSNQRVEASISIAEAVDKHTSTVRNNLKKLFKIIKIHYTLISHGKDVGLDKTQD